jgi:DNA processing protein
MACTACQRRAALIAALVPAISRITPLTRQSLLARLELPDEQLLLQTEVKNPDDLLRHLEIPEPTEDVPTALCRHEPAYPKALAELPCPPAVLYATCEVQRLRDLLTAPVVAIVGHLQYTHYGQRMAFELAHDLAGAGVSILSSINKGLEGVAHHGALHAHGRSIAVVSACPERPYLYKQTHLHERILQRGAAVSEFPPGFYPARRWCYIASQRIIAALASLVVVVEASERAPALFTAQIASEQGRDVAVVPGRVTDPGGHGTLALLRDGAYPVACAQDIIDLLHMDGLATPIGTLLAAPDPLLAEAS